MIQSFDPIIGESPKVLILGTMPGKESLRLQQYYGHPRNAFWKILHSIFEVPLNEEYQARKEFAKKHRIAIWDVCKFADRKSSLDSDIKNEVPNEIESLINKNPSIQRIGFNGQKAASLYDKYVKRFENIEYVTLLSTSPANARFTFEEKKNDWKKLFE
jgi:hypoxanthine-DNA glycosylase